MYLQKKTQYACIQDACKLTDCVSLINDLSTATVDRCLGVQGYTAASLAPVPGALVSRVIGVMNLQVSCGISLKEDVSGGDNICCSETRRWHSLSCFHNR